MFPIELDDSKILRAIYIGGGNRPIQREHILAILGLPERTPKRERKPLESLLNEHLDRLYKENLIVQNKSGSEIGLTTQGYYQAQG